MSTNQMSTPNPGVRRLNEVKRRRRLENLLYARRRIAMLAAEHRSTVSTTRWSCGSCSWRSSWC